MNDADMTGEQPGAGSAPAGEPSIPKWRLDEVLGRLRAREEELDLKNRLLNQYAPQGQQNQGPSAEDLGLDAQTAKAVQMLATQIADQKLKAASTPIQNQMAQMANKMEETDFLLNHGKEKSKYLNKIRERRQKHFAMTGGYMGVEDAYKLVMFDELTAKTTPVATPAAAAPAAPVQGAAAADPGTAGVPDSTQTRQAGGAGAPAEKTFDQMSLEEKEAHLERQMASGFAL